MPVFTVETMQLTIRTFNPTLHRMKKHFLICLLPLAISACKKDKPLTPANQQATIVGTWKETAIYNYTYDRGALMGIDTIPAMSNGAAMYTDFIPDGNYEAYTLTGNNHTDRIFEKYTFSPEQSALAQTWPAKDLSGNKTNVNYYKGIFPGFEKMGSSNGYYIISLTDKQLIISQKLLYFDFAISDSAQGYIEQMRILTRQ